MLFGANYGSGGTVHDLRTNTTTVLAERCPLAYSTHIAVSPNFKDDGRLTLTGSIGMYGWQDPNYGVPPPNGAAPRLGAARNTHSSPGTASTAHSRNWIKLKSLRWLTLMMPDVWPHRSVSRHLKHTPIITNCWPLKNRTSSPSARGGLISIMPC